MKENSKLDKKIKSSFESLDKKAPDMLWGKLADSLNSAETPTPESSSADHQLDRKVRESFSSLNHKAPQQVWQAINKQLNIDLVWTRLSKELDDSPAEGWQFSRWAAVLLLLLLSFGGVFYGYRQLVKPAQAEVAHKSSPLAPQQPQATQDSQAHPLVSAEKEYQGANSQTQKITTSSLLAEGQGSSFPQPQKTPYAPLTKVPGAPAAVSGNSTLAEKKQTSLSDSPTALKALAEEETFATAQVIPYEVKKRPIRHSLLEESMPALDSFPKNALAIAPPAKAEKERKVRLENFSVGPVLAYNNSWLLNNETRNSFDKGSLISTNPTFKQNLGLNLFYNLSHKNALAAEFQFISKAGQEYNTFNDGYYQKMGLELSYYKFYLQYQQNFLSKGKSLFSNITLNAGMYAGLLHRKTGEIRSTESSYSNLDYGIRLSVGQEKRLNNLVIGYGVRTERGLSNIFMGSDKMPARFNKTYTLNFGPYLNFRYNNLKGLIKFR